MILGLLPMKGLIDNHNTTTKCINWCLIVGIGVVLWLHCCYSGLTRSTATILFEVFHSSNIKGTSVSAVSVYNCVPQLDWMIH